MANKKPIYCRMCWVRPTLDGKTLCYQCLEKADSVHLVPTEDDFMAYHQWLLAQKGVI